MISLVRAGLGWLPPEVRRTASLLSNELEAVDVAIRGHDEVVLHNDFHEGNFVLDRPVGRISGIWDFSCVQTGSVSFDLRYLDGTSRDLNRRVARHYISITGRRVDLRAAVVANRVENVADAIETGRRDLLDAALARWAKVDAGS